MVRPRARALAFSTFGVAIWAGLVGVYWPFTVDDSFISMRYAQHIAEGIGPTWNAHAPHAEGYTSPLWICTLSIAALLELDLESCAKRLGVVMALVAITLSGSLAWQLSKSKPNEHRWLALGMAMFIIGALPMTAVHAVSGMETALATALGAAYAIVLIRFIEHQDLRHASWVAIVGFFFGLCRPEANLIVAIASLVTFALIQEARLVFGMAVLAFHVLPGALYFGWRWAYYDVLLPLPFYVKAVLPDSRFAGMPEVIAFVRTMLIERIDVGIACVVAVVALKRKCLPLVLSSLGFIVFFSIPAHQMGYDFRYFQPVMPVVAALAGVGIAELWARAGKIVPFIVLLIALISTAPSLARNIEDKRSYGRGIARAHAVIGRALFSIREESARPVLAVLDSGAIAFYSRWDVIDTWGLNEPVIATSGMRDADYVFRQSPSVVIVVSSSPLEFQPHFDYEQAIFEGGPAQDLEHVATFEFTPDYHLFVLAHPESIEARTLMRAASR